MWSWNLFDCLFSAVTAAETFFISIPTFDGIGRLLSSNLDQAMTFYCMPCPYGVDIAGILRVYNKCVADMTLPNPNMRHDEEYLRRRRIFLNRYRNNVKESARADHCVGCDECSPKCPQGLMIPHQMERIDKLVEELRRSVIE